MFSPHNSLTEFLAETNLILTQGDNGNRLNDLLAPIKNLLHKEEEILSFTIARYCGGDSRLAFFCEWYYQTLKLMINGEALFIENREYFRKKVPLRLKGLPNLFDLIDDDITKRFLPQQLILMNAKYQEMIQEFMVKMPYLAKYINPNFTSQFVAADISTNKFLYTDEVSISQYLDFQGSKLSYIQICWPALLGFIHNFNQEDSHINPKGVKWVLLEEVLKAIAILHQTATDHNFKFFVYQKQLSEKEEFEWLQYSDKQKNEKANKSEEVKKIVRENRDRIYKKGLNDVQSLVFPDRFASMLKDLLDWSYSIS